MLGNFLSWISCKLPHAKDIAKKDMAEAERQMLQHEAQSLYHSKMAEYYSTTYHRLNAYVMSDNIAAIPKIPAYNPAYKDDSIWVTEHQ